MLHVSTYKNETNICILLIIVPVSEITFVCVVGITNTQICVCVVEVIVGHYFVEHLSLDSSHSRNLSIKNHRRINSFINWVVRSMNADWLKAVVYFSNKARGGVVYGQYTTAKCCIQALRVASCLRTALSRDILAIYHTSSCLIA
jgi:hypothetical protein